MITQQYFDTYEGKEINVYQLSDKIDVLICPKIGRASCRERV